MLAIDGSALQEVRRETRVPRPTRALGYMRTPVQNSKAARLKRSELLVAGDVESSGDLPLREGFPVSCRPAGDVSMLDGVAQRRPATDAWGFPLTDADRD